MFLVKKVHAHTPILEIWRFELSNISNQPVDAIYELQEGNANRGLYVGCGTAV